MQSTPITFDISKDELPVFLAEVDEHLQALDTNLLRLERGDADPELVQAVFRSAHTIKGMSGMIGHRRMTDLTHALETALDGVRKNDIQVSSRLIDLCLEAVDGLRLLRDEVATSQVCSADFGEIVASLKALIRGENDNLLISSAVIPEVQGAREKDSPRQLQVKAKIDQSSMASAARAFQLMMALQEVGDIQTMTPSQAEIEVAASVGNFEATVLTDQPLEKVCRALTQISCVDEISINGTLILSNGTVTLEQSQKTEGGQPDPVKTADPGHNPSANNRRQGESPGRRVSDLTLRMTVERMDNLMNLVGELITDRNHLQQIRGRFVADMARNGNTEQFLDAVTHLGHIIDQLQQEVMHIRMLPIGGVFSRFPRMVHDMAQKAGKLIDVVIHGEETELDRSMIEEIYDPLIHLIRNSVDHGIEAPDARRSAGKPERGTITLVARYEEGRIILTVEDDGGGIDGERLREKAIQKGLITAEEGAALTESQCIDLIFLAGLSTAEKITEISGRGVGLDIVKTNIQRVNGTIHVKTAPGIGTQFQIVLPLTLAILPSLLVKVRESIFAIPMMVIQETLRLEEAEISYVCQKPVTLLRGSVLSLIHLGEVFNFSQNAEPRPHYFAVVVHSGNQQVGLLIDSLIGEEEVVVKPLGAFLGDIPGISSTAILGDGQVALIVDVFSLFKLVGI